MAVQMLTNPPIIVELSMVNHSQVVDAHETKVIRAAGLFFIVRAVPYSARSQQQKYIFLLSVLSLQLHLQPHLPS
jgi:hypothetical protein